MSAGTLPDDLRLRLRRIAVETWAAGKAAGLAEGAAAAVSCSRWRRVRLALGLSQSEVAAAARVSQMTVSRAEAGRGSEEARRRVRRALLRFLATRALRGRAIGSEVG